MYFFEEFYVIILKGDIMKNFLANLLIILFIALLIFSTYNIILWQKDNNNTSKKLNEINNVTKIKETNTGTSITNNDIKEFDPYYDYIKLKLIEVDFEKLKKINNDTSGWIKVEGTNINYPFVKGTNNSYYLTHSFDKSKNNAGWVFLDYRNNLTSDKNIIIYAHGRQNGTMFGSLKNTITDKWLNNKQNHIIKMSTEQENTMWQVFSIYKIPTTTDYLKITFNNNEFTTFTRMLMKRSIYNFNTTVNNKDRILTLSTCYNNQEKVVIHAKLIKIQKR